MSITLNNVTHTYMTGTPFERTAIKNVSFSINEGEFVAIIGHTGSGKSTLVQHLNGLLAPTTGTVTVDGTDINTKKAESLAARRKVGMVFQYPEYQLFEETIAADIAFGPRNFGLDEDEVDERVSEAMEFADLDYEQYALRSPFQLSGGQKQRIAIAGALAMDSRWLVLDEPTAMLDPQGRQEVLGIVKRLHKEEGIGIVYITHYMEEAVAADRVVVMKNGVILTEGTPHEIFTQTKMLEELGLTVPVATLLADRLRAEGLDLPQNIITDEELAAALCQLR